MRTFGYRVELNMGTSRAALCSHLGGLQTLIGLEIGAVCIV